MNKLLSILAAAILFVFFGYMGPGTSFADEHEKEQMESAGKDMAGMDEEKMKQWMEYATPGENHKLLDSMVGEWDLTIKWWMAPGAEPEVSTGTSKIKWIMDGRFIKHKVEGTSMGMPFNGLGLLGFNNQTKKYESAWIDNMGTGMAIGYGSFDAETKSMTETGTFSCPGEGEKQFRGVMTKIDPDSFKYEWYMPGPDKNDYLAMLIEYTRKKEDKK